VGPLEFTPILKRSRWGGRRLGEVLGKPIGPETDYAESWEICDLGANQSIVAAGEYAGWTLRRLIEQFPRELLGRHIGSGRFPLLVKFLDAADLLSVQVHPNDRQAALCAPGALGKTEAWIILAAEPGSLVYAGLQAGLGENQLRNAIHRGSLVDCLHRVEVVPGDCLIIPAGTVHAIGGGILLAEIQQSSDLTFRLFDWNRMGADGRPRELHIEQALACIDFGRGPVEKVTAIAEVQTGQLVEVLVKCPWFSIRRSRIDAPVTLANDDSCHILIGLSGTVACSADGGERSLSKGQTVLIPAAGLPAELKPDPSATVLEVRFD
jgi:mannose-6-phosphate isomerase